MNSDLLLDIWSRRRIRVIRQAEVSECGLAALAMIAAYHDLPVDIGMLRRLFPASLLGSSLRSLVDVADEIGLSARAVKLPIDQIHNLRMPAILHWEMNHYVVIEKFSRGKALIHNPEGRTAWYTVDQLSPSFTGIALELQPRADFVSMGDVGRLKLTHLWQRLTGLKRALAQTTILSLVMQLFVLSLPYYSQIAIDQAIPALDYDLITVLALGFGLFTIINVTASLMRSLVLLSSGTSLSFGITVNIARKLFRLPISWFERRYIGDILSRFQSVTPIQQAMTQGAVAIVIDGSLSILIVIVMFLYSATLSFLALSAFGAYAAVRQLSMQPQLEAQQSVIVEHGKEQSILIESVRGMTALRLFNRETARHAHWQAKLTDAVNADIRLSRIAIWQSALNGMIFGVENILSIWIAVRLVIAGGFSIGMLFAFLSYKAQFILRGTSLIDQAVIFKTLSLHLDRLSDIALSESDISFQQKTASKLGSFSGGIEARNVSFRYSSTDGLILKNIDLIVRPGDSIAITGPSGSGKSTLAKILLGLLEPTTGEVLVEGVPLAGFGHKNFRDGTSAVLEGDSLFFGSIAENIVFFDERIDREWLVTCTTAAAIHADILAMPMGYDTFVGDMGSILSSGQKQRILLARALYRRPKLLVLDESTSHLDSPRESMVSEAIRKMKITRIVIAHRAETLATVNQIYLLDNGTITHSYPAVGAAGPLSDGDSP